MKKIYTLEWFSIFDREFLQILKKRTVPSPFDVLRYNLEAKGAWLKTEVNKKMKHFVGQPLIKLGTILTAAVMYLA